MRGGAGGGGEGDGRGDPYRSSPAQPQFVCLVCYRSLSVHPGECPRCGVARLSLADPEVRADLRAEAERRLQIRHYGESFWCYLAACVMTMPVAFFVHQPIVALAVWLATVLVVGGANVKVYERLNGRSVLRLYAERRRRLAAAGTQGPKLLPARADDPEDAELPRVLALLGAKVE
jgi:hypothetical protein